MSFRAIFSRLSSIYLTRFAAMLLLFLLGTLVLGACGDEEIPSPVPFTTPVPTTTIPDTIVAATATPRLAITSASKASITIEIDQNNPTNSISPLIYGLAATDGTPEYVQELRPTFMRWGGNPSTRYNWVIGNAWNAARDYSFQNTDYGHKVVKGDFPPNVAEQSIQSVKKQGMAFLFTIPTMGWVAKDTNPLSSSLLVPKGGGLPLTPGSEAIPNYDPTDNRLRTSVQSKARKNAPFVIQPPLTSPVIYQDEWVNRIVTKFGKSADGGGVDFYAMDNEPELWSETHTDVSPTKIGYDTLLSRFLEYSTAVKAVDSTAKVTGPVSWGWQAYFNSELDRGDDNFKTAPDRKAHGDMPFLAWFLQEVRKNDEKAGYRTLDVLDIHYYPQSVNERDETAKGQELRLNAVRSLYDPVYVDESWIGQRIRLLPRMKEWINQYYPGTKLAISEWNFGADKTLPGGLAIANALGIFGREDVYFASYWRYPDPKGAGFQAFKLYTNFDGKGSRFGDQSIPAVSSQETAVRSFAALDSKSGRMRVILVNNSPTNDQTVELKLAKALPVQQANVYELSAATKNILMARPGLNFGGNTLQVKVPAYSAILLDMQP